MVQLHRLVTAMATSRTRSRERKTEEMPITCVRIISTIRATNVDSMNTSPWAKFTMPMMPNTMV